MKRNEKDFLQMVDSADEILFAYDKPADMLYFSAKGQEILGFPEKVRRYWKESRDWNRISQGDQEKLVNLLRQEGRDGKYVVYDVLLRVGHTSLEETYRKCRVEAACLQDEDVSSEIPGTIGKIVLLDYF